MSRLLIAQYEIGPLNNFLYLLGDKETKSMAVVDPAWDPTFLHKEALRLGFTINAIYLTHAHPDHVNGLDQMQALCPGIPTYISSHEAPFLTKKLNHLTPIEDRHKLALGGLSVDVIHTPGHTPGSQSFLINNQLIAGDTLFIDACGRCDLPGGDPKIMYKTLTMLSATLPEDTMIWPGHNYGPTPNATMGEQKRTNPYLQSESLDAFLSERMGF